MGRFFLVEYDKEIPHYFMCRICHIDIALPRNRFDLPPDEAQPDFGGFRKVVNVQVDEARHEYRVGPHKVADIYCVVCGDKLGFKYVEVDEGQNFFRNGYVKIMMNTLLLVREDQILDAVTMQPVPHDRLILDVQ